jgi:prohibitin 2
MLLPILLLVVNDQHLILCSLNTDILQGEAKSAQLIGDAISNNPAFITLRKIEASREIANTISTSQNRVFLSADSLLLNLQDMSVEDVALTSAMKNKK